MRVDEVVDRGSLEAYLNGLPDVQKTTLAFRVASRAAARVLPIAARRSFSDDHPEGELLPEGDFLIVGLFANNATASIGAESEVYRLGLKPASEVVFSSLPSKVAAGMAASGGAGKPSVAAEIVSLAANAYDSEGLEGYPFAARTALVIWEGVRADLWEPASRPLWSGLIQPEWIESDWRFVEEGLRKHEVGAWSFWIAWYERILAGKDTHPDLMAPILNTLTQRDWIGSPALVNAKFDDVLAAYRAEDDRTPLAKATPVDFSFDALHRVMQMVGIDDNLAHLRQPEVVQSFLDDAEEIEDLFQDFVDDAFTLTGGRNYAAFLATKAQKILKEFQRVRDKTHVRAEFLVIQASELEQYSKDKLAHDELPELLAKNLTTRIGKLKQLCRKHFGPSYLTLAPLAELTLDHVDQGEVVRVFDEAITTLSEVSKELLVPLDYEGQAILADMVNELRGTRAAILEANTEEFRRILEDRFAQSSGAIGLALGRFVEKSANAAGTVDENVDGVIALYKRAKTLKEIIEMVIAYVAEAGTT